MPKHSRRTASDRDLRYGNVDVFYKEYYRRMPCGNEDGFVARLAHSYIERPFGPTVVHNEVLEVGAGDGLHLPFVSHGFRRYLMTDINQESLEMAKARAAGKQGVECALADAQDLPYADGSVDRLIASCVLLHLPQPEQALLEWRRVTRPGGTVSIYIPNMPGLLTQAGRAITTKRAARRAGFEGFDLMIAREHINHSWGLHQLVRHVFRGDDLRDHAWPISRAPLTCRVFTVYQITVS